MKSLNFTILEDNFTIHRLGTEAAIPQAVFASPFYAIAKSENELSIVIAEGIPIESDQSESGWSVLRVEGSLDFSLTGILAGIASTLAGAGISIFAVSTFDTDYVLVRHERLEATKAALMAAGHKFG